MTQHALPFFDTAEAATKHAIHASGRSIKEVASHLWPGRTIAAAQTHLSNCLNDNRDEKLTADEHIAIATFVEHYDWLYYSAMRCSHSRPVLVTPEEVAIRLQQEVFSKASELKGLIAQIEALQPKLSSAKPRRAAGP